MSWFVAAGNATFVSCESGRDISDFVLEISEQVTKLECLDSSVHGELTEEAFSRLKELKVLRISGTKVSGMIPHSLARLGGLEIIDLSSNNLSGEIPPELLVSKKLRQLDLYGNEDLVLDSLEVLKDAEHLERM